MKPPAERPAVARLTAAALWCVLAVAILIVVTMTWHPWTIGERRGCPPGQSRGWDGWCR